MELSGIEFIDGVFIKRHTKKSGRVIPPHYRSRPGDYRTNWSMIGNVNPVTGAKGSASEEAAKHFQESRR